MRFWEMDFERKHLEHLPEFFAGRQEAGPLVQDSPPHWLEVALGTRKLALPSCIWL